MVIMISQPMAGKTDDEINSIRSEIVKKLVDKGHTVLNTLFDDYHVQKDIKERSIGNIPLYYLAKSLQCMARCDGVYFSSGWEAARGCKLEHQAAVEYGLKIIYEEESTLL